MAPNLSLPPVRNLLLLTGVVLALLAGPAPVCAAAKAPAKAAVKLVLRAAPYKDHDRLAFDGPRGMTYAVRREAEKVDVQFSVSGAINLVRAARLSRISGISTQNEKGKASVSFTVAANAIIKDFAKGGTVVIDVYGPPAGTAQKAASPADNKKTEEKTEDKKDDTAKAPKQPEAAKPEQPAKTPEAKGSGASEARQEPGVPQAATDAGQPETRPEPAETAKEAPAVPENVKVSDKPQLVAVFDPKVAVGAAIFERGGYGTILFDRKLTVDPAALTAGTPLLLKLEPFDLAHNNGFRFLMPENTDLRATRAGTAWKIFLVRKSGVPPVSTSLIAQPDFALGARLLLPTKDGPEPVRMTDPVVGDELIVLPLRDAAPFGIPRRMVDFRLLPSAQGLVIKPVQEKVIVRTFPEGIEITAEGGLNLTPAADTGATQQASKKIGGDKVGRVLFDFTLWRGKPGEGFTLTRQKLSQTIVEVPEVERNLARLELARFYFAHGMGEEALALLTVLVRQSPEVVNHPEFLALRGAVNILAGHAQDGLRDLNDPMLGNLAEVKLWQAVGAAQLRNWPEAEEKFLYAEDLLAAYPEPFRSRFSILAIESALGAGKDREAGEWLDRLENQRYWPAVLPAMKYLRGVLHSKAGHVEEAEKLWEEVAHSDDRLYKTRAELALVDLKVATHSMSPAQAADRLEGLRFAWRGDELELDILRRLGAFYIEAGNYKAGLAALAQGVHLYPNSAMTPPIRAEMAKTFHDIYLTDKGAKLSPIEALTLYQTYPDLLPSGDEGFDVKSNLAERLVAIDLLDQAATILEDQVKTGLKGEDKMRAGARLAAIRLLDHKPEAALAALDLSKVDLAPGPVADDLHDRRQLLRARAIAEQKKYDEALSLLQNMTSKPARILRADINMKAQRWADAAKALLDLIGPAPKPGGQLAEEQAQWLVKCAIALSLAGDMNGLDHLGIDYGAAMAVMPQRDTFRVLTRPENIGQMRDIATAQAKITEVDMFRNFLDAYRDPDFGKKGDAGTKK